LPIVLNRYCPIIKKDVLLLPIMRLFYR
jgi:hypothetical protein